MDHLAIPVRDQERSRRFYETHLGFGARPPRRYPDGVLMLYNGAGFALALGPSAEPVYRTAVASISTSSDGYASRATPSRVAAGRQPA